jgi:hypothetical protein
MCAATLSAKAPSFGALGKMHPAVIAGAAALCAFGLPMLMTRHPVEAPVVVPMKPAPAPTEIPVRSLEDLKPAPAPTAAAVRPYVPPHVWHRPIKHHHYRHRPTPTCTCRAFGADSISITITEDP